MCHCQCFPTNSHTNQVIRSETLQREKAQGLKFKHLLGKWICQHQCKVLLVLMLLCFLEQNFGDL